MVKLISEINLKNKKKNQSDDPLTLGDILNVMDGVLEQNGSITFITVNNPDKLHSALTRPGRIDLILLFDKANRLSLKQIIAKSYKLDSSNIKLDEFNDMKYDKMFSPAEIEEMCILHESFKNFFIFIKNKLK